MIKLPTTGGPKDPEEIHVGSKEIARVMKVPAAGGPIEQIWPSDTITITGTLKDQRDLHPNDTYAFATQSAFTFTGTSPEVWTLEGHDASVVSIDVHNGTLLFHTGKMSKHKPYNRSKIFNIKVTKGAAVARLSYTYMVPVHVNGYRFRMDKQNNSHSFMNISMIEMSNGHNWWQTASHLVPVVSSVYNSEPDWGGTKTLDGNTMTFWHTNKGSSHWIRFSYFQAHTLRRIGIRPREGWNSRVPDLLWIDARIEGSWVQIAHYNTNADWGSGGYRFFDIY